MSETSNQSVSEEQATGAENEKTSAAKQSQDLLDELLKPEVQDSLNVLVENLPKLAELTQILTQTYDFAQSVATDEVLINDFAGGFQEFLEPIEKQAKSYASTAIEAKDRAETSNETIGLFGLLRMLKDPQVQKILRFMHAFLEISEQKSQQR